MNYKLFSIIYIFEFLSLVRMLRSLLSISLFIFFFYYYYYFSFLTRSWSQTLLSSLKHLSVVRYRIVSSSYRWRFENARESTYAYYLIFFVPGSSNALYRLYLSGQGRYPNSRLVSSHVQTALCWSFYRAKPVNYVLNWKKKAYQQNQVA